MRRLATLLLTDQTNNAVVQLFRYTLVGGLAFAIDYASLFLFKEVGGIHYLWAAALAFTLGLVTNYVISVSWVFGKRAMKNRQAEFVVFALLGVMGLGLNELLMFTLTGLAGFHYMVSKLVSTVGTYAWNFLSRKTLLFSAAAEARESEALPVVVDVTPAN